MLASNYIPGGMTVHLQSENGILGLVRYTLEGKYYTLDVTLLPALSCLYVILLYFSLLDQFICHSFILLPALSCLYVILLYFSLLDQFIRHCIALNHSEID